MTAEFSAHTARPGARLACSSLALMVTLVARPTHADPITIQDGNANGYATHVITWTDSSGKARSVEILSDNHRITRWSYFVDGTQVVDNENTGEKYGIGNLVNHGGCPNIASSSRFGVSGYQASAVVSGPNHVIWRSQFSLGMCDNQSSSWRITNEYFFASGEDHFIQTV
ncbi:MAG TPA: hypothetical protein VGP93_21245, partial [Polyangiaceae bacterium]|nr:hypothetical protein [Polyangiaceae bacterium]